MTVLDIMPDNPIIAEIHRHREKVSRECDFDPEKIVAYYRRRELERRDEGDALVRLPLAVADGCKLREMPQVE